MEKGIKSKKQENKISEKTSNKLKDWIIKFEQNFWEGRIHT